MTEAEFFQLSRRSSVIKHDLVQAIVTLKNQIPSEIATKVSSEIATNSPSLTEESFIRILDERLSKRLDPLTEMMNNLMKMNAVLQAELQSLRNDHEKLRASHDQCLEDTIKEISDRKKRRDNIVISGVQEQESGSLDERREHNTEIVQSIFKSLDSSRDFDVISVQRIGRLNPARPRLLKVELNDVNQKNEILKKAKKLRKSAWDSVYINPDYTLVQNDKEFIIKISGKNLNAEEILVKTWFSTVGKLSKNQMLQIFDERFTCQ